MASKKKKNSLAENINARKKAGRSRPKSRSTISSQAYAAMEQGWPKQRATKKPPHLRFGVDCAVVHPGV